jgi:hypothetical protein
VVAVHHECAALILGGGAGALGAYLRTRERDERGDGLPLTGR